MNANDDALHALRIRPIGRVDLDGCAALLRCTFNAPPWNDGWTEAAAWRYLAEFADSPGFVGYLAEENGALVGAAFAHRKT